MIKTLKSLLTGKTMCFASATPVSFQHALPTAHSENLKAGSASNGLVDLGPGDELDEEAYAKEAIRIIRSAYQTAEINGSADIHASDEEIEWPTDAPARRYFSEAEVCFEMGELRAGGDALPVVPYLVDARGRQFYRTQPTIRGAE